MKLLGHLIIAVCDSGEKFLSTGGNTHYFNHEGEEYGEFVDQTFVNQLASEGPEFLQKLGVKFPNDLRSIDVRPVFIHETSYFFEFSREPFTPKWEFDEADLSFSGSPTLCLTIDSSDKNEPSALEIGLTWHESKFFVSIMKGCDEVGSTEVNKLSDAISFINNNSSITDITITEVDCKPLVEFITASILA